MNIYFDKEEEAFIRSQEKGWVRELVHQAILKQHSPDQESARVFSEWNARAREHFPPEPVKDVFGPRLKR